MKDTKEFLNRRNFLKAAAAGAAVFASGQVFAVTAKDDAQPTPKNVPSAAKGQSSPAAQVQQKIAVCEVCGHVEFGEPPEFCPLCNAEERFAFKNTIFSDALSKFKDVEPKHTPVIAVQKKSAIISDVPCTQIDVRIGKVMHELEGANHINYIDFYLDNKFFTRIPTSPQMHPAVSLYLKATGSKVRAVCFCSAHGYWLAEAQL